MTMKKLLSGILTIALVLSYCIPAMAADSPYNEEGIFQPRVTYDLSLTDEERAILHAEIDALVGDVGDAEVGDGSYDPLTLVGTMLDGSSYDSISGGSSGKTVPTAYPFAVDNVAGGNHRNEYDRKSAKFAWVKKVAEDLGFPVVAQYQEDKLVYVEIGDPDAPEMIMALSHLDSPPASITPNGNLNRWVNSKGELDPTAYHTPYVKNGWIYGAGIQDDSGPTLATLYAAKAMMEAGVPMDRRVRILMGAYEDNNPGIPTPASTQTYMEIPYYTSSPGFYDNWVYKYLNRGETPIAAYTSDSRFPVIVGNSTTLSSSAVSMNLAADAGKPFRLTAATAGVTLREGDPTLKDIVYGSASQIASRAIFTLNTAGANQAEMDSFVNKLIAATEAQGWLPVEGETPKVQLDISGDTWTLEINTGVAMEYPTPQYSKNAIVWGMYLLSEALPDGLQLKKAAEGIADLFFADGAEGEAYIGRYMGIPEELLRNLDNGAPNLTFALMGGINTENLISFYTAGNSTLSIPMILRNMHTNQADFVTATDAVKAAWAAKGMPITIGAFSNPTLYLNHANPLAALQIASFKATMHSNPAEFEDVYGLVDQAFGQGTTGGTLASDFRNKMTAFGAIIPGNERWWHTANERMKIDSAVQMTKMMADGMQEMARYTGPAGAQFMWADIPGLNANRAELDLLDVTIGTYQDASDVVVSDDALAATKFNIPMWRIRGNNGLSITDATYALGHNREGSTNGVYLQLDDADFLANTFVAPMRLEFKLTRPEGMTDVNWDALVNGGYKNFSFYIQKDGEAIPLALPEEADPDQFYFMRVNQNDSNIIYVSVNLAIVDDLYDGVEPILADSKTDLYKLNPAYEEANGNPFPERGAIEERGFFLLGDGAKDAEFTSPDAIYVTLADDNDMPSNNARIAPSAYYVKDGDEISVDGSLTFLQNTNTTVATFTWDPNVFDYISYRQPELPTKLVTWEPLDLDTVSGSLTVVLINQGYGMQDLGAVILKAKDGQVNGITDFGLTVKFIGWEDEEKIERFAERIKTINTVEPWEPVVEATLIELSNLIDCFGYNTSTPGWYEKYIRYDFNKDGEITIYDIAYLANLIV